MGQRRGKPGGCSSIVHVKIDQLPYVRSTKPAFRRKRLGYAGVWQGRSDHEILFRSRARPRHWKGTPHPLGSCHSDPSTLNLQSLQVDGKKCGKPPAFSPQVLLSVMRLNSETQ